MMNSILVATDASPASNRAVDVAADLAKQYGASLTILYVVRLMQLPPELRKMAKVEKIAEREADVFQYLAEQVLGSAVQRAEKVGAIKVSKSVGEGDPATVIIKQAKQRKADLIVMGTRGLGKVKEAFLGSVSRKVCNLSQVNCLTVR